MHPRFVDVLRCPHTGDPLRLEVIETGRRGCVREGALVSPSGRRYPIRAGVPRFVDDERYGASFGFEWARWPRVQFEAENRASRMAGHTTRMWHEATQVEPEAVAGRLVVEFGCGAGRFLDVVRRDGGIAIGLELTSAADVARANFPDDPDVLVVQGDVLRPPFRDGAFDGGFSIGVLHHTPEPEAGLAKLVRTVRPGGWVACAVYEKGGWYDFASVARLRRLHGRVAPSLGYRPALAYSYLSALLLEPGTAALRRLPLVGRGIAWLERHALVVAHIPDARWRILDTFDAITPAIASTHDGEEVQAWLRRAGCRDVRATAWSQTSVVGVRQ